MTTAHAIEIRDVRRFGGDLWFRAVCSCGKYRSGLHGYRGRAHAAGVAHVKAKTAT